MTLSTQLARWLIPYTAEIRELVEATANSARSSNDDTHKPNFQHPPNRVHQAGGLPEAAEAHDGIQALSWAPSALQSIVRIVGGTAAGCHRDQLRLLEVVEVNGITVFLFLGPQGRICDQLWGAFTVQSMSPWITAQKRPIRVELDAVTSAIPRKTISVGQAMTRRLKTARGVACFARKLHSYAASAAKRRQRFPLYSACGPLVRNVRGLVTHVRRRSNRPR
ncbi:MAG: hypothetical protein Q9221_006469 [Calogaya cf. arnoldii]